MKKCRSNGKECLALERDSMGCPRCKLTFRVLANYNNPEPIYFSEDCKLSLIQWTFDDKPNSETFIPEEE